MNTSIDFLIGFSCSCMVVALYLFHELVEVLKVLIELLRESLQELQELQGE